MLRALDNKLNEFKTMVTQLQILQTDHASLYQTLASECKITDAKTTPLALAQQGLIDPAFKMKIVATLHNLHPETIRLATLRKFQHELKTNVPREQTALDPASSDPLTRLHHAISIDNKNVLDVLRQDAKTIHDVFTPSTQLCHEKDAYTEKAYDIKSFTADPPDAILIMGNNDLLQIDHLVDLVSLLPKDKMPMILVSGFGGHGTVPGKIFALSEGDTIKRHLRERGMPEEKLMLETDAVDTGMNVKKIEVMMLIEHLFNKVKLYEHLTNFLRRMKLRLQQRSITAAETIQLEEVLAPHRAHYANHKTMLQRHVLISHSHAALLRGLRTFEKQATFHYKKISCVAPPKLFEQYYDTTQHALLNFMLALREIASFLDYTVNSAYLSNRKVVNEKGLIACIHLFVKHFNNMTGSKVNPHTLTRDFVEFSALKANNASSATQNTTLIEKLNRTIKPMVNYFRTAFMHTETNWMRQLPSGLTLRAQSERLDISGNYQRLGLIPATNKPKEETVATTPQKCASMSVYPKG